MREVIRRFVVVDGVRGDAIEDAELEKRVLSLIGGEENLSAMLTR